MRRVWGSTGRNWPIRAVEQQIGEQVVTAYQRVVAASDRIAAVRAHLANQDEILSLVRLRYQLGLATQLDTLQAAVGRANTVPDLSRAEATLRTAGARLNALMGREPGEPLRVRAEVDLEPGRSTPRRPWRWRAAAGPRGQWPVGGYPAPGPEGPEGREPAVFVPVRLLRLRRPSTDDLFDDGHDTWRAAVALNVPVFDGMLTRGLVGETDGKIRRGEAELTAQRRDVEVEVLDILAHLESARQTLAAVIVNLAACRGGERAEPAADGAGQGQLPGCPGGRSQPRRCAGSSHRRPLRCAGADRGHQARDRPQPGRTLDEIPGLLVRSRHHDSSLGMDGLCALFLVLAGLLAPCCPGCGGDGGDPARSGPQRAGARTVVVVVRRVPRDLRSGQSGARRRSGGRRERPRGRRQRRDKGPACARARSWSNRTARSCGPRWMPPRHTSRRRTTISTASASCSRPARSASSNC